MALRKLLILRRLAQRGLEGRTALIQHLFDWITASQVGIYFGHGYRPEFILGPRGEAGQESAGFSLWCRGGTQLRHRHDLEGLIGRGFG